jgi:TetR/AcrR family transcriptional regulator, transcriptional repressor for nem operon
MFVVHLPTNIEGIAFALPVVFISHLLRNPSASFPMPTLASSDLSSLRRRPTLLVVTPKPRKEHPCACLLCWFLAHFIGLPISSYGFELFPDRSRRSQGLLHLGMIRSILFVVRYRPEHKIETHEKIVKDASRRARAEGLNGAAVAAVMRDAGLTHGGFYKHFASKDELLIESLKEGFRETIDTLVRAAEQSLPEEAWKAIVKAYLHPETCEHPEHGCPLATLGSELARGDKETKPQIVAQLVTYKNSMVPFMPGRRSADKERAFFVIFSTMIGAVQIARMLPHPVREKVLDRARDFLLRSF